MKTFRYLTIAVLGLVMAACSSDIASEQPVVSHQGKGISFSATISMKGSATRSVMTESTSTISAAWKTGDELALVYEVSGQKQVTKATMTVSDDKSATITATIAEGVTTGTTVKLLYPYSRVCDDPAEAATYGTISEDALAGQDGTLETIANDYDLCQGDGEFTLMSDGTASLKADVTMASQIAIWKLSISDGTNSIKIDFVVYGIRKNPWTVLKQSVGEVFSLTRQIYMSLVMLITGAVPLNNLSGPVGIVKTIGDVGAQSDTVGEGLANVFGLIAFIAVNLAVMNLLPVPALDGGHIFSMIVFWLIGKIIRKQPSPKIEGYIHTAGLVLLLGLMAFVMFNDIRKLF